MSNSPLLGATIALMLVYVGFSGFVSSIHEWIARWLELRSTTLKSSLHELLQDPDGKGIAKLFDEHPLIKGLSLDHQKYATYIPSNTFAAALRDVGVALTSTTDGQIAAGASQGISGGTKQLLDSLLAGTHANIAAVEGRLAKWFDDSMERVSGEYKRLSQVYLLIIAAAVTGALNINSIAIAQRLWRDPVLRDAFLAQAAKTVKSGGPRAGSMDVLADTVTQEAREYADNTLSLGWDTRQSWCDSAGCWTQAVGGLMLTTLALSLGAPFWFDLLGKLVNLRQTGIPPDELNAKAAKKS
jgi:hypothetical protein